MSIAGYYTSPALNTALWPESMNPSAVNDAAREMQGDLAQFIRDDLWIQYGDGDGPGSVSYVGAASFKVNGTDVTSAYHAGRRVKITGATTGTVYAVVQSSAFGTDTTVTLMDATGNLQNETLTVWLSMAPAVNTSIPYFTSEASTAIVPAFSALSGTGAIRYDPAYGLNASGARKTYALRSGLIDSDTASAEYGSVIEYTLVNGSSTQQIAWGDGVTIGNPTGGFTGTGSLNLAGHVFVNGVQVTDTATTALAGIVELANAAEVATGTDQIRAVTPKSLADNATKDTTQGQLKFPGGLTLKYGTAAITGNPTAVTFTEAFGTACVSAVVTAISTTGVYRAAMIISQSASGLSIEKFSDAGAASSIAVNWMAVGY